MMLPDDDSTWLLCASNGTRPCDNYKVLKWCHHIRERMIRGEDSPGIIPGTRVCVPIVPVKGAYAEVSIDSNEIFPGSAMMYLVRSLPFATEEELIPLGMWSQGEGRMSISGVIQEWVRSRIAEDSEMACPQKSHGFVEMQTIAKRADDKQWIKANDWSIVYHDMCMPCFQRYQKIGEGGNFGMGDVDPGLSGSPAGRRLQGRFS